MSAVPLLAGNVTHHTRRCPRSMLPASVVQKQTLDPLALLEDQASSISLGVLMPALDCLSVFCSHSELRPGPAEHRPRCAETGERGPGNDLQGTVLGGVCGCQIGGFVLRGNEGVETASCPRGQYFVVVDRGAGVDGDV